MLHMISLPHNVLMYVRKGFEIKTEKVHFPQAYINLNINISAPTAN